jgi:hypothetical protein
MVRIQKLQYLHKKDQLDLCCQVHLRRLSFQMAIWLEFCNFLENFVAVYKLHFLDFLSKAMSQLYPYEVVSNFKVEHKDFNLTKW